jgi:site-specific DNA-methyltransferase (adenine-specific)
MIKIIEKKCDDLIPYENNARINDKAVEAVANSIKEFGMKNPIIIDKNNVIIAGHTRLKALQKLGIEKAPCIIADDLTEEQVKAFRIADNSTAQIAEWDLEKLNTELANIDLDMTMFGLDEQIKDIEKQFAKEIIEDDFDAELPEEPKSKLGDIYALGNHRLMCGDSTNENDVSKLVGEQKMDLLITDPPYNVDYTGKSKKAMKIQNDKMENNVFHDFLVKAFSNAYNFLKDGGAFYCWYASKEVVNFYTALEDSGFTVKQELIWNKNSLVMGRQDYQWKHEPCLYGWKDTSSHAWYSDRKQTTIINWDRPSKADLHPTMKPIGLFDYQIKNSSKAGDNILDLFGGSGTTIIACEQNNRNAYTMEYDPKYVDVIIKRWETLTGEKAEKIEENKSNE